MAVLKDLIEGSKDTIKEQLNPLILPESMREKVWEEFFGKLPEIINRATFKSTVMTVGYGLTYTGRTEKIVQDILPKFFEKLTILLIEYFKTSPQTRETHTDQSNRDAL